MPTETTPASLTPAQRRQRMWVWRGLAVWGVAVAIAAGAFVAWIFA